MRSTKAQAAGLVNGVLAVHCAFALALQGEVDQHDAVLFTIPISRMIPMMPITSSGRPNSIRVNRAPRPAEGKVEMMVIGWIVLHTACRE